MSPRVNPRAITLSPQLMGVGGRRRLVSLGGCISDQHIIFRSPYSTFGHGHLTKSDYLGGLMDWVAIRPLRMHHTLPLVFSGYARSPGGATSL